MRRLGFTGLAIALALIPALAFMGASASPGEAQACATLRFQLTTGDAVVQPFDRWLGELAGLTALTIECGTWTDGEAMTIHALMDGNEAWAVSFLSEERGVSMESSLMAEGAVMLREADALEARALMEGLRAAASGPAQRKLTADQFALLARGAAATLSRWGTAAKDTEGENCLAIADFLTAFSEVAEKGGSATWLTVTAEPGAPAAMSVTPGASQAPVELPGILAMEAFRASMRAIAAG